MAALVFALVSALRLAEAVLVPICIAIFIAILLHLPLKALQKRGVPRFASVGLLTGFIITITLLFGFYVLEPAQRLASDYPAMLSELRGKLQTVQSSLS
ncbi:MAG: AI-2E family transporter, partial [Pseudomonadota bacterium]